MPYSERLGETLALVSTIDPASISPGAVTGDAIDMAQHRRVVFIVLTGVLGT